MTSPLLPHAPRLTTVAALCLALTTHMAAAAPQQGPADMSFFTTPTALPAGTHGDLISYRPTTINLGPGTPAATSWNVLYQSKDSLDQDNVVSGTVFVPKSPWTGSGPRPVILYAVGTQGLANNCAPSRQFGAGTEYENANIAAALKAGYTVLVSDYEGYLSGGRAPTYMAGASQGHAVLDIFKAATGIPSAGIAPQSPVAIWGYSQGGQSASFAAELAPDYAPEVGVVGVASGGIPADLVATARVLNGSYGFAFLASSVVGLNTQYGDKGWVSMPINLIANDTGKAAFAKLGTQCIFKALFDVMNQDLPSYVKNNVDLESLMYVEPVRRALHTQDLGTRPVSVPQYLFHGLADEFIPLAPSVALKKAYCAQGGTVTYELYPSEHVNTLFQAAPSVLSWLGDRFAGKPAPSTCDTTAPDPVSTAIAPGGDLVVTMDNWMLNGKVHLKTLNQDIPMPAGASLVTRSNVTTKALTGNMTVPPFSQTLKIIGLKVPVGLKISPAGDVNGSVELDGQGILHVHGKAPVNISVSSIGSKTLGECKTVTPIEFPLDYDGPLSALGAGTMAFQGAVTFPKLTGCSLASTLSALMSGKGQTFTFTSKPPAPVKY
jgi:hypothetical protein